MKKTLSISCFLIFIFWVFKFAAEPIPDDVKRQYPQLFHEYVKYSYTVSLPAGMKKAIKEHAPDFKIYKMEDFAEEVIYDFRGYHPSNLQSFSAVFQDFNGDGRFDAALFGELMDTNVKKTLSAKLAILSTGTTGYYVVEMDVRKDVVRPVTETISLAEPGKFKTICGGDDFEIKNWGIMTAVGVGTSVHYWDKAEKKFKSVGTGGC